MVFDTVGKSSFRKCKPLLKEDGIYVSTDLGPYAQNPFLALITPMFGGRKVLFPIPVFDKEMIHHLSDLAESGKFRPVIDRPYTFDKIPEAFHYVHTGLKTGNVVVTLETGNQTGTAASRTAITPCRDATSTSCCVGISDPFRTEILIASPGRTLTCPIHYD